VHRADPYGKGYSDDEYKHERNQLALCETNPPEISHGDFDPLTSSEEMSSYDIEAEEAGIDNDSDYGMI
jgi:hypothetical protein